ncbi:DUF4354 family protein [Pantoea ananatis]|uniref:DUF4354 family protein n=1 Tax=Pantoea ananas TaxID=553 RepID=UPI00301924F7
MNNVRTVLTDDLNSKLIITAFPSANGTVVIEGQPKYLKKFNVCVNTRINQPIELTGFVGFYKAFDENGREFDMYLVDPNLLGTLDDNCCKWGEVSFMSDDESVYNARFVKWSSQCP